MLVLDGTILDATEGIKQLLGNRTRLWTEVVTLATLQVVDVTDRTDHCGCTTCSSLLEGLQLLLDRKSVV